MNSVRGYIARDGEQLKDTRVTILLREYLLEFINVIQDWGEITIDSSSVSECRGELCERGHFDGCYLKVSLHSIDRFR